MSIIFTLFTLLFLTLPLNGSSREGEQQPAEPQKTNVDTLNYLERQAVSSTLFYGNRHQLTSDNKLKIITRESSMSNDWMLLVLLTGLFVSAVAWFFFPFLVRQSLHAVFNLRAFYSIVRESSFFGQTSTYLLYFNYLLVLTLIAYQSLHQSDMVSEWQSDHPLNLFVTVFAVLFFFSALKYLFIGFLAWLFKTTEAGFTYLLNIFVFNNLSGLFFLPLAFYNAYTPSTSVIHAIWALFLLINIYRLIRGLVMGHKQSGFSLFYLILYLCAIELMPLLIMGKLVSIYLPAP